MIQFLHAMPSGAAVNIHVDSRGLPWVLLRRADDDFAGYPDPDAVVVRTGDGTEGFCAMLDYEGLTNGVPVWYQAYYYEDGGWRTDESPESVTPAYLEQPAFKLPDPVQLVKDRLDVGLQAELALGRLAHPRHAIPVLRSPPIIDNVVLPCVTVLLESVTPAERGIGDIVLPDAYDSAADRWDTFTGWFDQTRIQIGAWALNAEGRDELRRAIHKLLILNLPIFQDAGLEQIEFQTSDQFDAQSFGAPVYQTVFSFACLHPNLVRDRYLTIHTVESYPNGERHNDITYSF